jgi:hypothetical protein
MDEIKVNCKAADTLDIQDMTLFQGELKSRTDADYEHIKTTEKNCQGERINNGSRQTHEIQTGNARQND